MSREGRYRYLSSARAPRPVTTQMRDRCAMALLNHKPSLSEAESRALLLVVAAAGLGTIVSKADLDLAAGILGRLNAK